ncbi:MAG: tetratricopeptide repeat protein [Bacteroidales bacterium]|nr:tetratricopeptide repeat protein [Bacteroidales bacterium]
MKIKKTSLIIILISLFSIGVLAQKPLSVKEEDSDFIRAKELYNNEKYAAAIILFDKHIRESDNILSGEKSEAEFLAALSSIKLHNIDSEYRITRFVNSHSESPLNNVAWLELGRSLYQSKNYKKAIIYFEKSDRLEIDDILLPEYYFKLGYSHFMKGDRKRAMLFFSEIMDIDTEYTPPAIYYFSHIAYDNKMYRTALDGFMRLKDDESFGSVVPFYIVQIFYIMGDYDSILEIAPSLLDVAGEERASELYRIIGDAYFQKANYAEAVKNLEEHVTRAKRTGREGSYQLAYCYYMTEEYDKSVPLFREVCRRRDKLSQNAFYLLGDCYLKQGEKKMAQDAFSTASKMVFDKDIRQESLFNFAKLTYETTYSPFGEVIRAFQEYIEQYPGSDNIGEAYDYLVSAYMKVKNYKAAIESLDRIRHKDERLERAYQKVAFYRGLELYKNLRYQNSVDMFDKSLNYDRYDIQLRARALYWQAEAYYRLNDPDNALILYEEFMGIPGASELEEYSIVRYNVGYVYFNRKEYSEALRWFRNHESYSVGGNPSFMADLYNRIADCYYISTDYTQAIDYYDRVINTKSPGADYALFQKGFARGLMHDQNDKEEVLSTLIADYPSSSLIPSALFERGRAYINLENYSKGEDDFNTIISSHPNTVFVPRAMVQLGLLFFNTGDNRAAVDQYKKVIENYQSTPEARSALTGLRTTYVEMNDVESYFSYVRSLDGYADVSTSERDSLLYISGENLYISGRCDRASEIFTNYLKEFKHGSFRLNASFYLADCLGSAGMTDEALAHYLEVVATPNNPFLEQSYFAIAEIYSFKEVYDSAFIYYEEVERVAETSENVFEASVGQLRAAYNMGDPVKAVSASNKVLASEKLTEELAREATFIRAKSNFALDNAGIALDDFRHVAVEVTSSEGAESKFRVAEILFEQKKIADAESVVNEFIEQNTPHQYWMARMFILLSDISIVNSDEFQARATLQSLADYYQIDDDGILDEVKSRLNDLDQQNEVVNDTIRLSIEKKN